MTITDKRAVMHFRAEDAWLKLRDLRRLMAMCEDCLPLNDGTETELRRVIAEAQFLLDQSAAANVPELAKAAE